MILAIDTTGMAATCAIVGEEKTFAEFTVDFKKTHSETIMPLIDMCFKYTGLTIDEMEYIACGIGPGSFTGIRIGLGAAKGLAAGAHKKIIAVTALDSMAYNVYKAQGIIVPVMDARRKEVYACLYEYRDETLTRLTKPFAAPIEECIEAAKSYKKEMLFLGDGVKPNEEQIRKAGGITAHPGLNAQRASSLGALALTMTKEAQNPNNVKPLYIRAPQAEREAAKGVENFENNTYDNKTS